MKVVADGLGHAYEQKLGMHLFGFSQSVQVDQCRRRKRSVVVMFFLLIVSLRNQFGTIICCGKEMVEQVYLGHAKSLQECSPGCNVVS